MLQRIPYAMAREQGGNALSALQMAAGITCRADGLV